MPAKNVRTVDLLVGAFDLSQRRKFTIKNDAGDSVLDLFGLLRGLIVSVLKAWRTVGKRWTSARECWLPTC